MAERVRLPSLKIAQQQEGELLAELNKIMLQGFKSLIQMSSE